MGFGMLDFETVNTRYNNFNDNVEMQRRMLSIPIGLVEFLQRVRQGTKIDRQMLNSIVSSINSNNNNNSNAVNEGRTLILNTMKSMLEENIKLLATNFSGAFYRSSIICPHPGTENGGRVIDDGGLNRGDQLKTARLSRNMKTANGIVLFLDDKANFSAEEEELLEETISSWWMQIVNDPCDEITWEAQLNNNKEIFV